MGDTPPLFLAMRRFRKPLLLPYSGNMHLESCGQRLPVHWNSPLQICFHNLSNKMSASEWPNVLTKVIGNFAVKLYRIGWQHIPYILDTRCSGFDPQTSHICHLRQLTPVVSIEWLGSAWVERPMWGFYFESLKLKFVGRWRGNLSKNCEFVSCCSVKDEGGV